jgi:murein DD-endopeptidase MepM/ murein hydrolase activator NlpD
MGKNNLRKIIYQILLIFLVVGCKTTNHRTLAYQVKLESGDTLSSLAAKYGTTWQNIVKLNNLSSGSKLSVGQVILIRPEYSKKRLRLRPSSSLAKSKKSGLLYGSSLTNIWPVQGVVTSEFGRRRGRKHEGIDIAAKKGTMIRSVNSGVVTFVGWKRGYGRTVVINHGRFKTLYAHCSSILVKNRQSIRLGQRIARVGTTGNARGAHLHFEYRRLNNQAMNPRRLLNSQRLSSL